MKFALLILCVLTGCANAHPADFREYALRLDLANGVCSATAVGPHLVMTATHCMEGNRIVAINGKAAYALKRVDDGKDHSLVRVSVTFKRWAKVGGVPVAGDRIRFIGNPAANEYVYREGYISRSWAAEVWAQVDSFGGDSGAGVYCDDGRVCGVVSAGKAWTRGPFVFSTMVMYPVKFTRKQWKEMA
jgi:V8-like Glu-specific endopeptidase